jgi:hypothetical protein
MRKIVMRLLIAGLVVAGAPAALAVPHADAAVKPGSPTVTGLPAPPTGRATVSVKPVPNSRLSTVTSTVTNEGKTTTTTVVKPDSLIIGFCITAWVGRFVSTTCDGIGTWRQWAQCSASGFRYTSPLLPLPPVSNWIGACPFGESVVVANAEI